jgi:hypothetical protein
MRNANLSWEQHVPFTAETRIQGEELATQMARKAEAMHACAQCKLIASVITKRCGKCKAVYYCTVDCQIKHWPTHKLNCAAPASAPTHATTQTPTPPPSATAAPSGSPSSSEK